MTKIEAQGKPHIAGERVFGARVDDLYKPRMVQKAQAVAQLRGA